MEWEEQKEKMKQFISWNLDSLEEEMQFKEGLLDLLDEETCKESFLKKARQEAEKHPWICKELQAFVDLLDNVESIV